MSLLKHRTAKYPDETWDFRKADTKTLTHCFHNYPAMMIPQIAARLIDKYGKGTGLLFDPYCGTGTSLVEANIRGINAIGTDLNPLARLIAQTKTTELNIQILDLYLKEFNDFTFALSFGKKDNVSCIVPKVNNIDFWFDKPVQKKLGRVNYFIQQISEPDMQNFFKIAFSETVRESSWTRNSEFKLYRMTEKQRERFNPDVLGMMQNKLARNKRGLLLFLEAKNDNTLQTQTKVYDFNTVDEIPNISKESIDIVVTSPPYGDSRTTVAYGQFSRLANEWLGVSDANQVDKNLMGGQKQEWENILKLKKLREVLDIISSFDEKRAKEVASFYIDYQKSIHNVAQTLKQNAYVCYVVGNRNVKGVKLPTDEITKAFFESCGFQHQETIIRNIPNKRMPKKNSPTNITGKTATTMNKEYIVVMRKS